ncbi:MAG: hypothetical protein ACLGG7_13320 [Bacteriovoracia bacterium]
MKINFKTCAEHDLWLYVATHLKAKGIDTVLVGGAVVSIYSEGAYKSGDLDFVLLTMFATQLPQVMKEIGFERQGGRHYVHPECKHLHVEFPGSHLEIGEDNRITPAEVESEGQVIKILSPTDCVKDRLASYIHFKARECLDQAVLVARKHPVKLSAIKSWCAGEGSPSAFDDFEKKLKTSEL